MCSIKRVFGERNQDSRCRLVVRCSLEYKLCSCTHELKHSFDVLETQRCAFVDASTNVCTIIIAEDDSIGHVIEKAEHARLCDE